MNLDLRIDEEMSDDKLCHHACDASNYDSHCRCRHIGLNSKLKGQDTVVFLNGVCVGDIMDVRRIYTRS